jgi:fatty-acyl-CoA synthase
MGQQGEVCCRGYNVMKGYYNMPEATAKAIDADGWLHTGDLGSWMPTATWSITGRHKDMIIRGGENIYPREIEEFLFTAWTAWPTFRWSGCPAASTAKRLAPSLSSPGADLSPEDIRDFCRGQISRYKIPKHRAFVQSYPMTASGKVQKYKLQEASGAATRS